MTLLIGQKKEAAIPTGLSFGGFIFEKGFEELLGGDGFVLPEDELRQQELLELRRPVAKTVVEKTLQPVE